MSKTTENREVSIIWILVIWICLEFRSLVFRVFCNFRVLMVRGCTRIVRKKHWFLIILWCYAILKI